MDYADSEFMEKALAVAAEAGRRLRGEADASPRPAPAPARPRPAAAADPFDKPIDLADLLAMDLPDPQFVADGLLPMGLVILAAKPKTGKSWLVFQAAMAIASGRNCLATVPTRKRPVLYLALEDTRVRLRDRAKKMLAGLGWSPSRGLTVLTTFPKAGKGGLARLAGWFADHPGGVVIIDTLAKFRDPPRGGGSYTEDYEVCSQLKALADARGGLVVVVHHTRKGVAADPFDEVSGTLGLTGAADATLVLDRNRGEAGGTVYLTGRDLAEATLALAWDADRGLWSAAGREDGINRQAGPDRPATGAERCADWLARFMEGYAWPDAELSGAAEANGFTEKQYRGAKEHLRNRDDGPRLCSKKRGFGRDAGWWNWLGDRATPPADRPVELPG